MPAIVAPSSKLFLTIFSSCRRNPLLLVLTCILLTYYYQSWVECVGTLILRHSVQLSSAELNIPSLFNSAELNAWVVFSTLCWVVSRVLLRHCYQIQIYNSYCCVVGSLGSSHDWNEAYNPLRIFPCCNQNCFGQGIIIFLPIWVLVVSFMRQFRSLSI